jgi:steroid 5-alpha reductase family enzyme
MSIFSAIPLLGIVLVIANIVAFVSGSGFDSLWFQITLPSGGKLDMTAGWLISLIGLFLLYIEIFKATRTGQVSIIDHVLSLLVFVIALVQFIIAPRFAHPAFLALMVMMLIDVIAGFTVTISGARRDFATPTG